MHKILKIVIQVKKLHQNIQRNLDKDQCRKERVSLILDYSVHCLEILTYFIVFFKLNLFKCSIK